MNLRDISGWFYSIINFICFPTVRIYITSKDTFPTKLLHGLMESSDSGKQVDESILLLFGHLFSD